MNNCKLAIYSPLNLTLKFAPITTEVYDNGLLFYDLHITSPLYHNGNHYMTYYVVTIRKDSHNKRRDLINSIAAKIGYPSLLVARLVQWEDNTKGLGHELQR